jgi:hypothetical protein
VLLATVASCEDELLAPTSNLVPVQIVAEPNRDTLRLYDQLLLTVQPDTGPPPLAVHWTVQPQGDSTVADSFVFRPPGPGLQIVRAVAEFEGDAVGVAERRFIARPNSRPEASIDELTDDDFRRVPAGDTVKLVAVYSDPDGDTIALTDIRWYRETESSLIPLATGEELYFLPDSLEVEYNLTVQVADPAGASDTASYNTTAYDPLTPALWRTHISESDIEGQWTISSTSGGDLLVHEAEEHGRVNTGSRPLTALSRQGTQLWAYETAAGTRPIAVAAGDNIYLTRKTDAGALFGDHELLSLSALGAENWVMPPDIEGSPGFGPAVLEDGSVIVPIVGSDRRARLRRVSPAGDELWIVQLDTAHSGVGWLAVGMDGTTYASVQVGLAGGTGFRGATLLAVDTSGTLRWRLAWERAGTGSLAVADDSTLIAALAFSSVDSMFAIGEDSAVRWGWAGEGGGEAIVLGTGVAFYVHGPTDAPSLSAISLDGGNELWRASLPSTHWRTAPVLSADGQLILCAHDQAISFSTATGQELWRHAFAGIVDDLILTQDGLAVFVDGADYVEALDIGAGPLDSPWPMAYGGPQRTSRARVP